VLRTASAPGRAKCSNRTLTERVGGMLLSSNVTKSKRDNLLQPC
jgi:hypothetical protein